MHVYRKEGFCIYMEWISIKNRKPEDNISVIILDYARDIHIGYFCDNRWFKGDVLDFGAIPFPSVTHWLPLPELPRE